MGTFLDQRSSMNISASGATTITLTATPALFGVVGLQTRGVANPIVDLSGTIGISSLAGATVLVNVVRGTLITDPIIYTAIFTPNAVAGPQIRSFNAQDLLAPAAAQTAYSAFISSVSTTVASRVGPEVFWGLASNTV